MQYPSLPPPVTPSFIPLSHSSDRLRCWEALGRGGRVGFCFYGAENWLDHQQGKKAAGIDEASLVSSSNGVEVLVCHLAALRPTSLALPPRIWNGLRFLWRAAKAAQAPVRSGAGVAEAAMRILAAAPTLADALGGRAAVVATGGAAPNADVMAWVRSEFPGVAYMESYGATECGAITSNGLPLGRSSGRESEVRRAE